MTTADTQAVVTPADSRNGEAGRLCVQRLVKHLVSTSGGICSAATQKRVALKVGAENVHSIFADTIVENDDLYRFLVESVCRLYGATPPQMPVLPPVISELAERKLVLAELRATMMQLCPNMVWLCDGRTPWEVMRDERIIGGGYTGADPCSKHLKRLLMDKWRLANCDVNQTTLYFGIDWTEIHRLDGDGKKKGLRERMKPWRVEAPMTEPPYLDKAQMIAWLKADGIRPSDAYCKGYSHDNCGGFCIKAGQAHHANQLRNNPARYAYDEQQEQEMRELVGDYSMMKDRRGGKTTTLTLKQLRERIERSEPYDLFDYGGCGCAVDA